MRCGRAGGWSSSTTTRRAPRPPPGCCGCSPTTAPACCCWRTRTRPCRRSAARRRRWSGGQVCDGPGPGELGARTIVLRTAWRHDAGLRSVVGRIAERVGAVGAVQHRRAVAGPARRRGRARRRAAEHRAGGGVRGARAAQRARRARAWRGREMAVVARSGAQVTALRRALTGASVPVSVLGSDVPLREEPAARPLLDAMRVCVGAATLDAAHGGPAGVLAARWPRHGRPAPRPPRAARPGAGRGRRPHQRRAARRGAGVRRARGRCRPPHDPSRAWPGCWRRVARPRPSPVPTRRPSCGRCGTRPSRRSRGAAPRSPGERRASGPTGTSTRCWRCSARPRRSWTACRARRRARSSTGSRHRTSRRTRSPHAPGARPCRC